MTQTRVKTRDAGRTRDKILQVATTLFAEKGFDGCSTNEIVRKARVNKRMLFHYFEDKEGLYREALTQQWLDLGASLSASINGTDSRESLLKLLETFYDYVSGNPYFSRLLMWEGLAGGATSRKLWADVRGPLYKTMAASLERAQNKGLVDPKLDPAHLIISFIGTVGFYFAQGNAISDMVGKDSFSAAAVKERKFQIMLLFKRVFIR